MSLRYSLHTTTLNSQNLEEIQKNIHRQSPYPEKVKIIAVTKTFNFSAIIEAEKKQIFDIGENRVQETQEKLKKNTLNPKTQLHLIGHLQTNKAPLAVGLYNTIQSIDSIRLLKKINQIAEKKDKKQKVFLQINIANQPTQTGFNNIEIFEAAKHATDLEHINFCGIMAIGPKTSRKEKIKKSFYGAQQIKEKIKKTINPRCTSLSIGMSQDYIIALQAGATHLRLGSILFNTRGDA
tara:strand:+ start:260 stop:970 length:711 start_codon:yes stop_codon:yes gene_type:complete